MTINLPWNSNNTGNSYGAEGIFWVLMDLVFLEKIMKIFMNLGLVYSMD